MVHFWELDAVVLVIAVFPRLALALAEPQAAQSVVGAARVIGMGSQDVLALGVGVAQP